jgi:hypothetical protein
MEIENDYLAQIFSGDQIFLFQEDSEASEYNLEESADSELANVKEPASPISKPKEKLDTIQKEVVVLVNEEIGSQEQETLSKLMKAIGLEGEQYEVVYDHPDQLKSIQHLKLFLSFHNQYLKSTQYSILKINKANAIYAHDLAELNQDNSKKLMLWNLLKQIV